MKITTHIIYIVTILILLAAVEIVHWKNTQYIRLLNTATDQLNRSTIMFHKIAHDKL